MTISFFHVPLANNVDMYDIQNVVVSFGAKHVNIGLAGDDDPKFKMYRDTAAPNTFPIADNGEIIYHRLNAVMQEALKTINFVYRPGVLFLFDILSSKQERAKCYQMAFEEFGFAHCSAVTSQMAALYASGRTTGMIIDIGHKNITCLPIYDSIADVDAMMRVNYGFDDIPMEQVVAMHVKGGAADVAHVCAMIQSYQFTSYNHYNNTLVHTLPSSAAFKFPQNLLYDLGRSIFFNEEVHFPTLCQMYGAVLKKVHLDRRKYQYRYVKFAF